ncbi:MAG: type II toxin-antitoxin system HigB family toxin [Gemmatimonadetes bacterium]|jgi:mRNA interferase HigB|nr:type II toxin-antitoxin system HigB family toxin [Gemmatimonadota bacterium]MBA4159463.1 type II toxin-antitoxin system HigB family toxin [Gemmatimonadota bacterium]
MKVVGRERLEEFCQKHSDVRAQVNAWLAEAEEAEWKTPLDVKARYAHASFMADNRVVFNLKGNRYRLDVKISYQSQVVLVKRIGTHAEYNSWKF